jgi:VWFA-related protein
MRLIAVCLFASLVSPAFAQEKLTESIEVRVVNVDVVVRDRAGKPVTGLTRDDFEVFDNGQKLPVTNLSEIAPKAETQSPTVNPATGAGASAVHAGADNVEPQRPRKIVILIDNYSIHPFRRNAVFKSVEKFLDRELRGDDQVMIVVHTQSPKVLMQFTGSREAIRTALENASSQSNGGFYDQQDMERVKLRTDELIRMAQSANGMKWGDAYSSAVTNADAYAEHITHQALQVLDSLNRVSTDLAGVEGKKVLVFAGAHLPERPGAELYNFVHDAFAQVWPKENGAVGWLPPATSGFTGLNSSVHTALKLTADRANASGVTLYMIDAADDRDSIGADNRKARAMKVPTTADLTEKSEAFFNTAMAYHGLARATGGVAILGSDNFDLAFDALGRDLDSYYSLGYKAGPGAPGARHDVVVKLRNPAYSARAKETYTPRSEQEAMNERVIANIHSEMHGQWQVTVAAGTPLRDGSQFKVPIQISMSPTLTLLPKDDQLVGAFTVFIAVGNESGGRSTVTRVPRSLTIPPAAEKDLRAKPMTFGAMIMMSPGENTLSVGILDQISNSTGFSRATVVAR